jgi:hypothetical protein
MKSETVVNGVDEDWLFNMKKQMEDGLKAKEAKYNFDFLTLSPKQGRFSWQTDLNTTVLGE